MDQIVVVVEPLQRHTHKHHVVAALGSVVGGGVVVVVALSMGNVEVVLRDGVSRGHNVVVVVEQNVLGVVGMVRNLMVGAVVDGSECVVADMSSFGPFVQRLVFVVVDVVAVGIVDVVVVVALVVMAVVVLVVFALAQGQLGLV